MDLGTIKRRQDAHEEQYIPQFAGLLKQRSTRNIWECDLRRGQKFNVTHDSNFLWKIIRADLPAQGDINIYEHKDGLQIISSNGDIKATLRPACENYYFRDWTKNGICVKSTSIFVRRAYAIITPESVKVGDYEESGMIDEDEGLAFEDINDVTNFLCGEGISNHSGCPPGTWYEGGFESNPDDESQEQTSYHISNANPQQEIELFKKMFPLHWKQHCPDI